MNADKRIYFVKYKRYDVMEEMYAVFDSKEKAQEFIGRYKDLDCLEIIDGTLNPEPIKDHKYNAFYISLEQTGNEPIDIFMCDYSNDIEGGRNEEHNICFYAGAGSDHGLFISKIFAATEEYALNKAIHIRNEAIANGEWDQAWERYELQQSRLSKKGDYTTKPNYI